MKCNSNFIRSPNVAVRERKRIETKVAEEYSWAITGGEAVMLRPIRVQSAGVQMDSLLYTG